MKHYDFLKIANEVAKDARARGNTPFGAVLAGPDGSILMEQGNAEGDLHDATFAMGAAKVLETGQKDIELIGPVAEIEAEVVEAHKGFWNK